MLLLQSILVYGFIIWVMTYNANRILKRKFIPRNFMQFITDVNVVVPIIIFCFFCSIRWGVGVDCNSYMKHFYNYDYTVYLDKGELGFVYIQNLFRDLTSFHVPFFFVLAFLQLFFLYYGLKMDPRILLFFPLMLFLSDEYWIWMNAVRQMIVCCMFVYITFLAINKRWIYSIIWIFVASLFHKSALVLLPLLLLCLHPQIIIPNKWVQLIIVLVCYLVKGADVTRYAASFVEDVLLLVGYEEGEQSQLIDVVMDITFGFRSILLLLANCIVIYFSEKMREFYSSPHFNVMYNFYFIGVCASLVFYGNHGIERFLMYFTCFTPIIFSCCAYYLYAHIHKNYLKTSLKLLICLLLVRTLFNFYMASQNNVEFILYKTIFTNEIPY